MVCRGLEAFPISGFSYITIRDAIDERLLDRPDEPLRDFLPDLMEAERGACSIVFYT